MGRLPSVMLVACAVAGCDGEPVNAPAPSPSGRANQVTAKASEPTPSGARPAPLPKPRKKPRQLCEGQSLRDPPGEIDVARSVDGAAPAPLRYGNGKWIWVNVWAAWCKPCKEEMPLLLSWRDRLADTGQKVVLAFVSIDDDEREMKRFLESQPKRGVRASYWIAEEAAREEWFESIGFDEAPQLPVHALVNPDGKLACVIEGAVEVDDYPAVEAFLKR